MLRTHVRQPGTAPARGLRRNWAIIDAEKCLGCGVCYQVCRWGARSMVPRPHRSFTPETTFDRIVSMAIERRKLGDLLLDQTDGWTAHALARLLHVFEQTPVATALVGIEPLRSTFLRTMVAGMRRKSASGIG